MPTWALCEGCGDEINREWPPNTYCEQYSEWRCEDCGPCSCSHCTAIEDDSCDCSECRSSRGGRYAHDYSYKPSSWRPKGNWPNSPLLGVELEVSGDLEDIVEAVHCVDDCEDHLYLKEDGSLEDGGLEIVSHPMTLAYAHDYPFAKLLDTLRASGASGNGCDYDGNSTYGLHVHVSRNAFRRKGKLSASHAMCWLLFMARNDDHLQRVARRKNNRWAAFKKPAKGELVRKATDVDYSDRYQAINCRNERTYELRFFKSTVDSQEFYAALELADATVEYTRGLSTADILRGNGLKWSQFAHWVDGHDYPNLSAEIAARIPARYL